MSKDQKLPTQKLIPMSDECKEGCHLDRKDAHLLTDCPALKRTEALANILRLVQLNNSLSEFRRGMTLIQGVAEEALK